MRSLRTAIVSVLVAATIVWAFILIDDTHDQTVGGTKTHVLPVIGSVVYASLPASPTDGEMQYCSDCTPNTSPCTASGSGAMALRINGAWYCIPNVTVLVATPTPPPTATPQPTTTPFPTDTPLIDLLYSGKLNLGANASGTPLGLVSITANATPAPHDRVIKCAPPNATPVSYTMPAATGSGRVIDMINTTGSGSCSMDRAGGDSMNSVTSDTLTNQWDADTCYDISSAQWACRNLH